MDKKISIQKFKKGVQKKTDCFILYPSIKVKCPKCKKNGDFYGHKYPRFCGYCGYKYTFFRKTFYRMKMYCIRSMDKIIDHYIALNRDNHN